MISSYSKEYKKTGHSAAAVQGANRFIFLQEYIYFFIKIQGVANSINCIGKRKRYQADKGGGRLPNWFGAGRDGKGTWRRR